jgi:DNA-binding protein YbaB
MSSLQDQLDQLMSEFNETTKALNKAGTRLRSSTHSKRSKNRMVSVTVDSKGDITKLDFHTTAYRRMAPAELGEVLLSVIKEARSEAQAEVQKALGGFMPTTILTDMVNGEPPTVESMFGELEKAFAWGRKHQAPEPSAEKKEPAETEDGWTGERKAVAKPARMAKPEPTKPR